MSRHKPPRRTATRKPVVPSLRMRAVLGSRDGSQGLNLEPELATIRAGILYADDLEVISPMTEMFRGTADVANMDRLSAVDKILARPDISEDQWEAFSAIRKSITEGHDKVSRERMRLGGASDEAIDFFFRTLQTLDESVAEGSAEYRKTLDEAGFSEIEKAWGHSALTVRPLLSTNDDTPGQIFDAYTAALRSALSDHTRYLVLDPTAARDATDLLKAEGITLSPLVDSYARAAKVGVGILARLPVFDGVPLDELLDLRREAKGLPAYRTASARLGEAMKAAPFSPEAQSEVDRIFRDDVAPALDNMREGLAEHSFTKQFVRHIGENMTAFLTGVAGAPALAFTIATAMDSGSLWKAVAVGATPVGSATEATIKSLQASASARKNLARGDFFYLHDLARRV